MNPKGKTQNLSMKMLGLDLGSQNLYHWSLSENIRWDFDKLVIFLSVSVSPGWSELGWIQFSVSEESDIGISILQSLSHGSENTYIFVSVHRLVINTQFLWNESKFLDVIEMSKSSWHCLYTHQITQNIGLNQDVEETSILSDSTEPEVCVQSMLENNQAL